MCLAAVLPGCQLGSGQAPEPETNEEAEDPLMAYEMIEREPARPAYGFDYSDIRNVLPRPQQETSKVIQWIDMDAQPLSELMMITTLQGNVNRVQPSMYVIRDEIVEGPAGFNASRFWFEKLDEQYTGADKFEKVEYTDPYQMVVDNKDKFKGAIIYHERLTDAAMASRGRYRERYGDIALLNLTLMLCAYHEAIALNRMQYTILKEDYGLELEILGDTTKFMEKNEDGSFSDERGSREVWDRVYRYALDKLADGLTDKAIAHNPGFQAAQFDYIVANKIFTYNRIFGDEATEQEREMELSILSVSKPNTPIFGVWYLQEDEGNFAPLITQKYKYFVVTYETFNLSWTSGLPYEPFTVEEPEIELDPTKKYVSFSFTEGDNISYLTMRMPLQFESARRGEVPVGWSLTPTVWDLAPNVVRYLKQNWAEGDGLVMAEGYVYFTPPEESRDGFFALQDAYFARTGSGAMRMLLPDPADPLPYAEKMSRLDSLWLGYLDTNNDNYNNDSSHFLFRDRPVFVHYNGNLAANLAQADGSAPAFYAVTLYGWNADPGTAANIMESLGDEFVAVTPKQLAQLYRQYYASRFKDITQAAFSAGMTREEMGFLYRASNYTHYSRQDGSRYADGNNEFVYRFDLADGVSAAKLYLAISGNARIEVSADDRIWYVLDRRRMEEITIVSYDLTPFLQLGKTLYVRFADATPENDNGAVLYRLHLSTDLARFESVEIDAEFDAPWRVESEAASGGSAGEGVVYRIPLADTFRSGDLAVAAEGDVRAYVSAGGGQETEIPLVKVNGTHYGKLDGIGGTVHLRIAGGTARKVKLSPTPDPVAELSFSPVANNQTEQYLISLDPSKTVEAGLNSSREVTDGAAMVFRFATREDVGEAKLDLRLGGMYAISVSNDGAHYTKLARIQEGDDLAERAAVDITPYAAGGKTVYVKIETSTSLAGKSAKLYKLRLLTDRTSETLLAKVEREREPDAVIRPDSEAELKLLDENRSRGYFLYNNEARALTPNPDAEIVYRLDVSGTGLFDALGLPAAKISRLRVAFDIGNAYKISISKDGVTWTEFTDTSDETIQSASNRKDLHIPLTEFLGGEAVYVKISHSSVYRAGLTHDGLWWSMKFYIN